MKNWLEENIKPIIPYLTFLSVLTLIVGLIYGAGKFVQKFKDGALTPIEKVEVIGHVKQAPNDVDVFKAQQRTDSIAKAALLKDHENITRDSIRYDLVKRNVDQIYLMNKKVEHLDSVIVKFIESQQ